MKSLGWVLRMQQTKSGSNKSAAIHFLKSLAVTNEICNSSWITLPITVLLLTGHYEPKPKKRVLMDHFKVMMWFIKGNAFGISVKSSSIKHRRKKRRESCFCNLAEAVLRQHYMHSALVSCVAATHPIVICAVDVSGHAKVSDLDHQALPHQTVAGCQVAVDEVQGRQVDHARGDLGGDVQHLRQSELPQRGHLRLLQDASVGAVSSTGDTQRHWSSAWSSEKYFCFIGQLARKFGRWEGENSDSV